MSEGRGWGWSGLVGGKHKIGGKENERNICVSLCKQLTIDRKNKKRKCGQDNITTKFCLKLK